MKMRVSLSQRGGEIAGTVELPPNDPAFALEALALVVERIGVQYDVPADQVVRDLYSIVNKKVR